MAGCSFFLYKKERKKIMRKERTRVKRAMELALEHLDYIIDHRTAPDLVEVTGRIGGDVITYRIYNDGSMYER